MKGKGKEDDRRADGQVVQLGYSSLGSVPASVLTAKNLVALNLSNNDLASLPPELCSLRTLRVLHVSSNKLKELPSNFNQLFQLETLSLGANQLTAEALDNARLDKLGQLSRLNLCSNRLSYIPESIFDIDSLIHLTLADNQIGGVPDSIIKLQRLQYFGISNNRLTAMNLSVGKIPALKAISMAGNPLKDQKAELVEFSSVVSVIHASASSPRYNDKEIVGSQIEPAVPTDTQPAANPNVRPVPKVITALPDPVYPRGDRFSLASGESATSSLSSISESDRATLFGNSPNKGVPSPTTSESTQGPKRSPLRTELSTIPASMTPTDDAPISVGSISSSFSPTAFYGGAQSANQSGSYSH